MKEDVVVGHDEFSKKLAKKLEAKYINVNLHVFPDNEIKPTLEIRSIKEIEGKDILLVSRTNRFNPRPNDAIIELGLTAKNLKIKGARKIDVLMPYMFYARQDESFRRGEPESFSYITDLYQNWINDEGILLDGGIVKNLITLNSHLYGKTIGIDYFFSNKINIHDLSSSKLFADHFRSKELKDPVIITPGAKEIASELSDQLNIPYENLKKKRNHKTGRITMEPPKTNLKDRDAIIFDDMTATGNTILEAYGLACKTDALGKYIALPHLMARKGIDSLCDLVELGIYEVVTTDSFDNGSWYNKGSLTELSTVPLFSEYIKKL